MSQTSQFRIKALFGTKGNVQPFVSLIVPVRNEGERLSFAIHCMVEGRSSRFPLQIVVVDDCSSDGCCSALEELSYNPSDNVEITVIELPHWSGIPYARNTGATCARAEILFITDANVYVPRRWDVPIRNRIRPNTALCAAITDDKSSFRAYGGVLHLPSMGFNWLGNPVAFGGQVPLAPSAGTILPRELFHRVGGYDTAMPVYGAAEPEFSVRLWLSGAEIVCVPELELCHRFRPAAERRPFLDAIRLIQVHNYVRFGVLYLDRPNAMRVIRYYAAMAPEIIDRAVQRVLSGDIWERRDFLAARRQLPFEFFLKRFGFLDVNMRFRYG